jgi:peptide subunit release factor 1 (eRF1)
MEENRSIARALYVLAVALALCVAIGGCGGGGSTSSGGSSSRSEFIAKANAACKRERHDVLKRIGAFMEAHSSEGKSPAALNAGMVKAVLLPTIRAEMKQIEALGAPPGDEKRVAGFLAAQRAAIDEVDRLQSVGAIEEVEEHFNKASDQMRVYGISSCANSAMPVDRKLPGWQGSKSG